MTIMRTLLAIALGVGALASGPSAGASASLGVAPAAPPVIVGARPVLSVTSGAISVTRGGASWYRWPLGHAAAGPGLRRALGVHWRYQHVTVCYTRCIRVVLDDWCGCPYGRVIDLSNRSFAQLAPLSRGVIPVRIWR